MSILRVLSTVPFSNRPPVQDIIANLHSYFTFNFLIGLAILLSYKQFGGRPIECMTPAGFSSSWTDYTENYCYTANTYFVAIDKAEQIIVNISDEERRERRISYYQWIPFFLIFQAGCFKVPALIWKYFHAQSGMKVGEILRIATSEANSDPTIRADNINSLCNHLQKVLKFHRRLEMKNSPSQIFRLLNMKYSAYYVTLVYLLSKCLFFINVTGQLNFLNRYLFGSNDNFGFEFWRNLLHWNSTFWKESGVFPRVTWCDFDVREMGQSVNHTVQCVLVLNVFMEKAFMLLWDGIQFWQLLLWLILVLGLFYGYLSTASAEHFIFNHLEMAGEPLFDKDPNILQPKQIQQCVAKFIVKYLKTDGLFILRLIAQHADVQMSTQLIYKMWTSHYIIEKTKRIIKKIRTYMETSFIGIRKMTLQVELEGGEDEMQEHTYPKMGHRRESITSLAESETTRC
uniref:Innexin n=1 Tax=Meloidogyne enterolobii TaxID=390850 RepID=A0A6V7WQ57_MELEN|nr:unnamed protein product [Meloidogyne enterolobii]